MRGTSSLFVLARFDCEMFEGGITGWCSRLLRMRIDSIFCAFSVWIVVSGVFESMD